MRITRVLNSNAVMVDRGDDVAIVLGKGVGYGRRPGQEVEADRVADVFVPDRSTSIEWLTSFLTDVELDVVRVAGEITELAHQVLGLGVSQAVILPLADHISFAIERTARGIGLDFPLRWEVEQLYPREMAVARQGLTLVGRRLGAALPSQEAGAIAMHLVNAQFGAAGMAAAVDMTARIGQVLEVVEAVMGVRIDHGSMAVARFVTHLRYLFIRMDQSKVLTDAPVEILRAVARAEPEAYRCARRVRHLLDMAGPALTEDEVLYLALHIARLAHDTA